MTDPDVLACPHCGWRYNPRWFDPRRNPAAAVPDHYWRPKGDAGPQAECPGNKQTPRPGGPT